LGISALVDQVLKSGAFPKTSAATLRTSIDRAGVDHPYQNNQVLGDLPQCQKPYPAALVSDTAKDIQTYCASAGIDLYVSYQRTGSPLYVGAFTRFLDYLKTRPDLNDPRNATFGLLPSDPHQARSCVYRSEIRRPETQPRGMIAPLP
jgi:hypothetical protein